MDQENKFTSIDEILLKHLEDQQKADPHHRNNDWWYASELGRCQRKSFLRRLGLVKSNPIADRILFTFEIGNRMHDWIQEILGNYGVLVEKENTIIDEESHYRGRSDEVISLYDEKAKRYKLVVADIKTQRGEAFFHRAKQQNKVKDFQKMQLASYYYFLKKKRYPKLEEGRFFFFDRSGGCRDEIIIKFTPEDIQKVVDELEALNKYWETQTIPPRCGTSTSWECKFCDHRKTCKEIDKGMTIEDLKKNYAQNTM